MRLRRRRNDSVPEPVRRDRVIALLDAIMVESDTDDRTIDDEEGSAGWREYRAAAARRWKLSEAATPAERAAAEDAARRNGYLV